MPKTDRPLLTKRETDVLTLVAEGLTNSQIGQTLGIGEATVRHHISRIYNKLDITNRVQATHRAEELNLIRLPEVQAPTVDAILRELERAKLYVDRCIALVSRQRQ